MIDPSNPWARGDLDILLQMKPQITKPVEGDILAKYTNLEQIHTGGEGRIYKGNRISDGLTVAIKEYNNESRIQDWDDLEKAAEGASKEIAFLYKSLGRSGVAQIIEHGETGTHIKHPVMVMKYIQGETVEDVLKEPSFSPTIQEAYKLAKDLGKTITYAHEGDDEETLVNPLIHRDLKPGNIMIDSGGNTIVLDWSTGKLGTGKTEVGTVFNSMYYTSPEVAEPIMMKKRYGNYKISPASDVFSLAKILQHYLLGERFIDRGGKVKDEDYSSRVPKHMIKSLDVATRENPKKRYKSVDDFVNDFVGDGSLVVKEENQVITKNNVGNFQRLGTGMGIISGFTITSLALAGSPADQAFFTSFFLLSPICLFGGYYGGKIGEGIDNYLAKRKQKQLAVKTPLETYQEGIEKDQRLLSWVKEEQAKLTNKEKEFITAIQEKGKEVEPKTLSYNHLEALGIDKLESAKPTVDKNLKNYITNHKIDKK